MSEDENAGKGQPPIQPRSTQADASILAGIPLTNLKQKYEILCELGSGASGTVYKARQLPIGRLVAIKMIHSHLLTPTVIKRFFREAKTISRFSHPNIISIFDFGISEEKQPFMVMDYVDGSTLDDMIRNIDPFPLDLTKSIVCQVCDGLAHAHAHGILHRDLKPRNLILVRLESGLFLVKILDFGLAKILEGEDEENSDQITKDGETVGTPAYMSPEQVMGKQLDQRSDLYSLGCVMYHCLAGAPPFVGETRMETMLKQLNEPPLSLNEPGEEPFVPIEIEALMMKTLAKQPSERPQSMTALKDAMIAIDQRITYAGSGIPFESLAENRFLALEKKPSKKLPTHLVVSSLAVAVIALIAAVYLLVSFIMPDSKQPTESTESSSSLLKDTESSEAAKNPNQIKDGLNPFINQKFEATIANDPKARSLSCEGQAITDSALTNVASMPDLEELNLEKAAITNAGLKNLEGGKFSVLNLMKTKINGDAADSLTRIPQLRDLNVSHTAFDDRGVELIASIPTLTKLTLDDTLVTEAGCKSLSKARNLEGLSLQNAKIGDTAIGTIVQLKDLTSLNLNGTAITNAGVKKITGLRRLSNLKIGGTQITDEAIDDLASMPSLAVLNLSDTKLTDASVDSLCKLEELRRLGLVGCKISRKAILKFQRKFPSCILELAP